MPSSARFAIGLLLAGALVLGQTAAAGRVLGAEVVAVDAGLDHTCVVLGRGTVECWGSNASGQLGNGTTQNSLTPVVAKEIYHATAVNAGAGYTCALLRSGRIACWGTNESGELGNGSTKRSLVPVAVKGIEGAKAVSADVGVDTNSTCALLTNGRVKCWGSSSSGELGNVSASSDKTDYRLAPVTVTGIENATAITSNYGQRCALLATGEVKCWGDPDTYGDEPVRIKGVRQANSVSVGYGLGCAVISTGKVKCWIDGTEPASGVDGVSDATAVASTGSSTCALVSGGKVRCWGDGAEGVLGNGTAISTANTGEEIGPVDVKSIAAATTISASADDNLGGHVCVIVASGAVECWGSNSSGELGNGVAAGPRPPSVRVARITNAATVSAGGLDTCASLANGQVKCWGMNQYGQLGDRSAHHFYATDREQDASPTPVVASRMKNAVSVAVGRYHACALLKSGSVRCWGAGGSGQLGIGRQTYTGSHSPLWVKRIRTAVAISAGGNTSCALLSGGEVACWGDRIGLSPVTVRNVSGARAISVDRDHASACALVDGGKVECWRYPKPRRGDQGPPTLFSVGIDSASAINASSACAVVANGRVECWRDDDPPVVVKDISSVVQISDDSCAVLADGTVECWKKGEWKAERLTGIANARAVTAGDSHNCALIGSGAVRCWGEMSDGQLGDGVMPYSPVPVRVIGLP